MSLMSSEGKAGLTLTADGKAGYHEQKQIEYDRRMGLLRSDIISPPGLKQLKYVRWFYSKRS
jgi:hypothetical protein